MGGKEGEGKGDREGKEGIRKKERGGRGKGKGGEGERDGSSLRSAERGDLFVPRTRTMKLSRRSFTVAAPVVWNSLPAHLSPLISRGQFRAGWA